MADFGFSYIINFYNTPTKETAMPQSKDVENQLTCTFNGKTGLADRLLNAAHNRWLATFTDGGLGAEMAYRDAVTACIKAMHATHGSIRGYIAAKNLELRGMAAQKGLKNEYDVEFDGLATAKVRKLDTRVNTGQPLGLQDREMFTTLFLDRFPMAVASAKSSMADAVCNRRQKKEEPGMGIETQIAILNRVANMANAAVRK